jgi:molecular chaperone DnaJ
MTAVGARLRWAGHGWQRGRARGALVVEVASSEMPAAAVKGDDLRTVQPISMVEWLRGGEVSVSAPEGRVLVTLEPRHPPATKLRLSGRGLPRREGGRGDLMVTLQPRWPVPTDAVWSSLMTEHRTLHSGLLDLFSARAEAEEP